MGELTENKADAGVEVAQEEFGRVCDLFLDASRSKKKSDYRRADEGLGSFLKRYPTYFESSSLLANTLRESLISEMCGDPDLETLFFKEAEGMMIALGIRIASPLERLLIDRVVICWLRVQQAELKKSAADKSRISSLAWDRRLEMANKSFFRAVRSLAFIRRKPMPQIVAQVNIGSSGSRRA